MLGVDVVVVELQQRGHAARLRGAAGRHARRPRHGRRQRLARRLRRRTIADLDVRDRARAAQRRLLLRLQPRRRPRRRSATCSSSTRTRGSTRRRSTASLGVLREHPEAALVAPADPRRRRRRSAFSLRRFPRAAVDLRAGAVPPPPVATGELDRRADPRRRRPTSAPAPPEWVSGACMLVRRSAYEAIGGFDERFFLYCEDTDLCRRLWQAGHAVRFEPGARSTTSAARRRARARPARSPRAAA